MRGRSNRPIQIIPIVTLAFLPALAHAQSINTWSLPEPEASSTPREQGPVDSQNPVILSPDSSPTPAPSASTAPTPIPTITPLPVDTSSPPTARPSAPASGTATQARPAAPPETAATAPTASPTAELPPPPREPQTQGAPETKAVPVEAGTGPDRPWWWAVAAGVVAVLALGLFLFKRRGREAMEWEDAEEPSTTGTAEPPAPAGEPEVYPAPVAEFPARPLPMPNFTPTPSAPAASADSFAVVFDPVTMRLSLFYATLQYRLTLTAPEPKGRIAILGDLISAHASLTQDEQLAPPPESLPEIHALQAMPGGEPVELQGEIQLPLAAIRALRQGGGSFFVPLVRICVIGEDGAALRRVFTLGIPGSASGLAPLRTDTGPRSFEPLAAREIEMARQLPLHTGTLPLDPRRAAS